MITSTHDRHGQGFEGGENEMHAGQQPYTRYSDPALINPDELATFPKQVQADGHHHTDHERHHPAHRTPVRDGRNITRTDNHPDKNGFM